LLVRPADALAGLIEVRGLGIRRLPFESLAVVGLLVDLAVPEAGRLPDAARQRAEIAGIALPRLIVATATDPLPIVLAHLKTSAGPDHIAVR
jgi:serine kinase of HPr protein (carbohydrate metabolism regulator)